MEHKFVILGKLPGLNEYTAANRTNPYKGGKMKKDGEQIVIWSIRQQMKGLHIDKPVRLHYHFFEPNRRRDLDNISAFSHKVIQDALVKCGVLQNDGWKEIIGYTDNFSCDKNNPRIEVILEVLE